MAEYIFTPINYADGIPFYYAKNVCNQRLYRLEPVATRLRWEKQESSVVKLRPGKCLLTKMVQTKESFWWRGHLPTGTNTNRLEAVRGDHYSQLTREVVAGRKIKRPKATATLLPDLPPAGTYCGCPDWRRINWGPTGLYMPDPLLLRYLDAPKRQLPRGLTACHPPEVYQDSPLSPKGDLFYFGLLAYLVLTGELPYLLVRGWPTPALQQGLVIPPTRWQPDLPVGLAGALKDCLRSNHRTGQTPMNYCVFGRKPKPRRSLLVWGRRKRRRSAGFGTGCSGDYTGANGALPPWPFVLSSSSAHGG